MDKKPKFCIPIVKSSQKEVLETISKNRKNYDYFEVWLDHIEDLDVTFVKTLDKKLGSKLLLLFRRQKLEKPKMSLQLKTEILKTMQNSKALFDFDVVSQKKDIEMIKKMKLNVRIGLSYHNYKETPNDKKLFSILSKMEKYHPEIYKISSYCNSDQDAVRLLNILVKLQEQKKPSIILGMGAHGIYTRICGMFLGNLFSFAPMTFKEASAPGQLTRGQLLDITKTVSTHSN